MNVTKNDLFYLLISIVIASAGAVAVSNVDNRIGIYGLLGLVGLAVVMAIIIKPSLGANILVFAVYTNISDLLTKQGLPGIIKPLVAIVALALLVRYLYVGQASIANSKTSRTEFFLLAYFAVVVASFLVASDKDVALKDITDMGKDLVVVYCILFALRQARPWKQTMWLIMITTAMLAVLSAFQWITHNYSQTFWGLSAISMQKVFGESTTARVAGPINAPNLWGQILVSISTLIVFRIIHEKKPLVKAITALMVGVIWYAVLNTYSRGAYLVLAVDVVLILFVFEKGFNPLIAFAGLGALILVLPFLPAEYLDRFDTLTAFTSENAIYQDTSFRGRSSEMLTGLAMFAEHPILGVGTGNYPANYQHYTQLIGIEFRAEARDPHSLYVQILAETGILGLIAFLAMALSLFSALNRACKAIEQSSRFHEWLPWMGAIRLAVLSYLMTSIILHNAYIRYFWMLIAMALTGIQITYNLLNNSDRSIVEEAQH